MTDLVPDADVFFEHGTPGFAYTKVYRCFPGNGNGLLFRLVNDKKQWAFYNDTKSMVFRVAAKFGKGSSVQPLGRVKLIENNDGGLQESEWRYHASVVVEPGRTERFMVGDVRGFELNFSSEALPDSYVEFKNGFPAAKYDNVYKCLQNHDDGLLFRLVSVDEKSGERMWSYYNDTKDYTMEVTVEFADKNCVRPLGKTRVEDCPDNAEGAVYKISVAPLRTESFLSGDPHEYRQSVVANAISDEEVLDPKELCFENGGPNTSVIAYPSTKIIRGFKEKGNGLVFLIIDKDSEKWAFYNDTTDYTMAITVKFGPGCVYKASEKTSVSADPGVVGGTICVIKVPPLSTELFLTRGNPEEYKMSISAESVYKSEPEEQPEYKNGGPDRSLIPHNNKAYKCFRERGNGLLFRIVDDEEKEWVFYNDTRDFAFTVKVNFEQSAYVQPLGNTKREEDIQLGPVYVLEVPPLSTEPFVRGDDLSGFSTRFSGKKVHPM